MGEECSCGKGWFVPSAARTVAGRDELWARLFSLARVSLGMDVAEVLRCTPMYMAELRRRYEENLTYEQRLTEVMLAQVVAMVANTGFRGFKDVRQPKEFMPSQWDRNAKVSRKVPLKQRKAAVADVLRERFAALAR